MWFVLMIVNQNSWSGGDVKEWLLVAIAWSLVSSTGKGNLKYIISMDIKERHQGTTFRYYNDTYDDTYYPGITPWYTFFSTLYI